MGSSPLFEPGPVNDSIEGICPLPSPAASFLRTARLAGCTGQRRENGGRRPVGFAATGG